MICIASDKVAFQHYVNVRFTHKHSCMQITLLLFLLLLEIGKCSFATETAISQNFPFKVLEDKNTNHIGAQRATIQDNAGFMWFGGDNGLVRYDGYSAKLFRHDVADPDSISANLIYDLLLDREGNLWIATVTGVNRFDAASQKFIKYFHDPNNSNSLPSNDVRSILQDKTGKLWFGTALGMTIFNPNSNSFTRFEHQFEQAEKYQIIDIWTITEDAKKQIWIGCRANGLFVLDTTNGNIRHFSHNPNDPNSLSHDSVQVTYEDRLGDIWIGTPGGGLNKYDQAMQTFIHYRHDNNYEYSIGSDFIRGIFEDHRNNFWIATDGGGLSRLDREAEKFVSYKNKPGISDSLKSDKVRSIYEDRSGNLWLGHFPYGISMLDTDAIAFQNYRNNHLRNDSLSHNSILSILEHEPGKLWVGTEQGLNLLDLETNKVIRFLHDPTNSSTLAAEPALSLHENQQGVWVGTWSGGLNLLDLQSGKFKHYKTVPSDPNSISGDYIWVVYEDSQNNIWLGSETAGLNKYDPQNDNFLRYPTGTNVRSERGSNWVTALREDSQGNFWVGTDNGLGLMDRQSGAIEYFREDTSNPNGIRGNRISAIVEDRNGNLWIATHGAGINRKQPKSNIFTNFDMTDGLADNVVSGIIEDNEGILWFSTGRGLSRFDPNNELFTNYYKSNGLAGEVFNRPAYFKTSTNKLLFGSTDGLTLIDPQLQVLNLEPPPIVLTEFKILNKTVKINEDSQLTKALGFVEKIVLTHQDLVFSLEFAALNFRSSEKNLYSYKLVGFDESWSPANPNRIATYTNLDAGKYVFKVKGSNNEGIWNEQGNSIEIVVLPPPWKSWPAFTLYALIVLSIITFISYQQLLKLRDQQRLQLALWGSGDEFWDVDLVRQSVVRKNMIDTADRTNKEPWHFPDMEFIHPDDRAGVLQKFDACLDGKEQIFEVSYRVKSKLGGWIWLLDRGKATKFDINGVPVRFSGTTKNIDRIKAVEKELTDLNLQLEHRVVQRTAELQHTAQKLEQSNKYLKSAQTQIVESEKMASLVNVVVGISHELNTPLGNVLTSLTVLRARLESLYEKVVQGSLSKRFFNQFKDDANESVRLALQNLNRTTSIVDTFKMVAASRDDDSLNQKPLKEVLYDAVKGVQVNNPFNTEHVKIDCPDGLILTTYNNTLQGVVMQLMENSIYHAFGKNNDIIVQIDVQRQADSIKIDYQDFGKGMDKQTVNLIFDPFYTTKRGNNVGLGMHIVYNQVTHLLKGTITCESQLDKGTRFIIELPYAL